MNYRPEIDGLRSIAVLSVVLFHAGISVFSGGFLGVDVFFVISGYLITRIILTELEKGEFSLLKFYERRARRILPALSAIVLICIPGAWLFMLPDPLENFGQSILATMLSLNNVLLTMTSGYWDLASEFKPLIHTWSLAVEEQFYVIFPLLLMFFYPRLNDRTVLVVWLVTGVSFSLDVLLLQNHPTSTFYLLHTRAWELGAGALGAFSEHTRKKEANNPLSIIGMILVFTSILMFNESTPHPSYFTVIPVLGTLLVLLYAKDGTVTAQLLSINVFVSIGLISYSLYLWHQPLFAFARIISFEEPRLSSFMGLLLIAFLLAYLTWRFVEQPFRQKSIVSTSNVAALSVAITVLLSSAGLLLHLGQGFPTRFFSNGSKLQTGMHIDYNHRINNYNALHYEPNNKKKVLIIGNSQARDFANILIEMNALRNAQLIYKPSLSICEDEKLSDEDTELIRQANIIFVPIIKLSQACENLLDAGGVTSNNIIFVGPKHFGYNLNAFTRLAEEGRSGYTARIFDEITQANAYNKSIIPSERYIDIISYMSEEGTHIRIFDDNGDILSADRVHITQAGAEFLASHISSHPALQMFQTITP